MPLGLPALGGYIWYHHRTSKWLHCECKSIEIRWCHSTATRRAVDTAIPLREETGSQISARLLEVIALRLRAAISCPRSLSGRCLWERWSA
jgi:hypothetical protein